MKNHRLNLNEKSFFLIALILTVFVRLRYADAPLERDEGEYAYAGMMILRGQLPYADFYNMKLPGVYYLYALIFKIFGQSVSIIRLSLLFFNLLTTFFVFKIGESWLSRSAAWWASAVFLLLSFSFHAQGWIANCEQFVNFFVALGFVFLHKRSTVAQLCVCGLMLGVATLMKQHAFHFALFPVFLLIKQLLQKTYNLREFLLSLVSFGFGFVLPLAGLLFFVCQKGIFDAFYFYIVQYAVAYSTLHAQVFDNIDNLLFIIVDNALLWILLFVSFFLILKKKWVAVRTKVAPTYPFTEGGNLCVLLAIAYMAVCPGWYFRPHYFQYLFIPAALLMAYGLVNYDILIGRFAQKANRMSFLVVALLATCAVQIEYFVLKTPDYVTSTMYRSAYFTEIRQMSDYLKLFVKDGEYVGQLSKEPQIWFYTKTAAASGFLYAYPLIENHALASQMAEQYMKETESHHPNWFIYADLRHEEKNSKTIDKLDGWAKNYLKDFEPKGILYAKNRLKANFETNFLTVDTTQDVCLVVYKRKMF